MSNIITSQESSLTTKDRAYLIPLPAKTDTYSPVPHKAVIETVLEGFDKAGIRVINETYKMARDGKQLMGNFNLAGGDSEMHIKAAFHNSYDKSMPLRMALGANIIVCSNGMVRGDMGAFKRKHTGTVLEEFKQDMGMYINTAGELFETMKRERERMKDIEVTKRVTAELIGRMFLEDDIINATQMSIIKRELENPSFDYKADGTLWQKYNAVTVALKEAHPQHYLEQHMKLHKFISNEFELA